ncbi:VCBS repeat-containing protein [Sorangium sp. So ce185]|uniref:FG-GAP repeat domain-containing protein n=1 Tax=Sorangium sp. So ce185 TaxID=3133287 RepID=UPI003F62DFB4
MTNTTTIEGTNKSRTGNSLRGALSVAVTAGLALGAGACQLADEVEEAEGIAAHGISAEGIANVAGCALTQAGCGVTTTWSSFCAEPGALQAAYFDEVAEDVAYVCDDALMQRAGDDAGKLVSDYTSSNALPAEGRDIAISNAPDRFIVSHAGGLAVFHGIQFASNLPRVDYAAACPGPVAIGDLNHDGRDDVVVVEVCNDRIVRRLSDASGNLGAPLAYGMGTTYIHDVALGDFNGDGHLDVVTANQHEADGLTPGKEGYVTVRRGTGTGSFLAAASYKVAPFDGLRMGHPVKVVAADMNGDGFDDIVTANLPRKANPLSWPCFSGIDGSCPDVSILRGAANGFLAPVSRDSGVSQGFKLVHGLVVDDFNTAGAGMLDIAVATCSAATLDCDARISILRQTGGGTSFAAPVVREIGPGRIGGIDSIHPIFLEPGLIWTRPGSNTLGFLRAE